MLALLDASMVVLNIRYQRVVSNSPNGVSGVIEKLIV